MRGENCIHDDLHGVLPFMSGLKGTPTSLTLKALRYKVSLVPERARLLLPYAQYA